MATRKSSGSLDDIRLAPTLRPDSFPVDSDPIILPGAKPSASRTLFTFNPNVMPNPKDFDKIQLALVQSHAADIKRSRNQQKWVALHGSWLQKARASHALAFPRAVLKTGRALLFASFLNPGALLMDPIGATYGVIAYGAIFYVLLIAAFVLAVLDELGLGKLVKRISNDFGGGFSLINWSNPDMFVQSQLIANAKTSFVAPPKEISGTSKKGVLSSKKYQYFDLDVCKTLLLMSSIMYEREDEWVLRAAEYPRWTEILLLKSEEKIHFVTRKWGIRFASVSDFTTVAGPYCGIFYSESAEPWMVVAFKGTSPSNYSEWLVDTTIAHESAGDWLWGDAHQGFYTSLFPSAGSGSKVVPYERIMETIQLVARELQEKSGTDQKIQVYITGHSLGAGLASLFYARCLKAPDDMGDHCELRDGYTFGTPRVGDNIFVTAFEECLNQKQNQFKNFWRICNQRDFVCTVPPGLADLRERRTNINPDSLLNYGAIGGEMHLTPRNHEYFYHFNEVGLRAGRQAKVVEKGRDLPNFPAKKISWTDPIQWTTRIGPTFPWLFDHFTTEYWRSLIACQGTSYDAPDDERDFQGPSTLPTRLQPSFPPSEEPGSGVFFT
ncbi:alpha/beta-hydrolase [Atractiella rhizophila]|nr:alpha/beta-hydrolase [Atractiella rhizophila]